MTSPRRRTNEVFVELFWNLARKRSAHGDVPHRVVGSALEYIASPRRPRDGRGARSPLASQRLPIRPGAARPRATVEHARTQNEYIKTSCSRRRDPRPGGQGTAERFPCAPASAVPPPVVKGIVRAAGEDVGPVGAPRDRGRLRGRAAADRFPAAPGLAIPGLAVELAVGAGHEKFETARARRSHR